MNKLEEEIHKCMVDGRADEAKKLTHAYRELIKDKRMALPSAQEMYNNMLQAQQANAMQQAHAQSVQNALNTGYGTSKPKMAAIRKLLMRLDGIDITSGHVAMPIAGFEFLYCAEVCGKVFVFVITQSGKTVTFEEEEELFPRDQLITQLNLLR